MLHESKLETYQENVFKAIGKDWMLISAGDQTGINAMTASWGGMGVLWNKQVVYIFIRPQRYTKKFMDEQEHFAITFFDESYRDMLAYMGKISGKDEDKIKHCKLTVLHDHAPYFQEAKTAMICRKLFVQELDPNCFLDASLDVKNYPLKDYHYMYVGEIEKVFTQE